MAIEIAGAAAQKGAFKAGADLSAKQYFFVKLDTGTVDQVILPTAATDVPIGVLQNTPKSGEVAEVLIVGGSKVSGAAALAIANLIGTNNVGEAVALTPGTDTTKYVVGQVIEANAAAHGYVTAMINCSTPHRAA